MEDVLSVYRRPYDPDRPVVCMDEMPRQLLKEVREPLPAKPGQEARYDHHYKRNGVVNLFTFFEPLGSWRTVMVRRRRTAVDWARCVDTLLTEHYPDVETVVLVMDNLNTHKLESLYLESLYKAFPARKARRLASRLEIHFTPEHGSWLNMAEIEQSAIAKQCLSTRIPTIEVIRRETTAWADRRNEESAKRRRCDGQLAIPDRRCADQAEASLSKN